MSEQMKGNPYISQFFKSYWEFGDQAIAEEGLTDATIIWQGIIDNAKATLAVFYEQRTANLIAAYQNSNLVVMDADRQEIEREILERLGVRDA